MTYIETSQPTPGRDAWLGASHGYRIAGDLACLNAELALSGHSETLAQQWALQLWACDQPYQGGALAGIKIAEAPVDLNPSQPQHLYAETFARLPAGDREYAMVLVLASRSNDAQEQVHDFANYPAREHFCVPALRGEVSFAAGVLRAERIENPRGAENLSGTLALELWALNKPYSGEQFTGSALAGVELGRLAGQRALHDVELAVAADALAAHRHLTVMLREWTASGYVTRDYRNLEAESRVAPQLPEAHAPEVRVEPEEVRVEAPALEAHVEAPAEEVRVEAPALKAQVEAPAEEVCVEAQAVEAHVEAPAADVRVEAQEPETAAHEPAAASAAERAEPGPVSVSHATLDQLAAVPGLTRKVAQEIIKARPFKSLDELTRVRGIGDKTLRKLRAALTL